MAPSPLRHGAPLLREPSAIAAYAFLPPFALYSGGSEVAVALPPHFEISFVIEVLRRMGNHCLAVGHSVEGKR